MGKFWIRTLTVEQAKEKIRQAKERPNILYTFVELEKEFQVYQRSIRVLVKRSGLETVKDMRSNGKYAETIYLHTVLHIIEQLVSAPRWAKKVGVNTPQPRSRSRAMLKSEVVRKAKELISDPEAYYPIAATMKALHLSEAAMRLRRAEDFVVDTRGLQHLQGKELLPEVLSMINRLKYQSEQHPPRTMTPKQVVSKATKMFGSPDALYPIYASSRALQLHDFAISKKAKREGLVVKNKKGNDCLRGRDFLSIAIKKMENRARRQAVEKSNTQTLGTPEKLERLIQEGMTHVWVENDPEFGPKPVKINLVNPDDHILMDDKGVPKAYKASNPGNPPANVSLEGERPTYLTRAEYLNRKTAVMELLKQGTLLSDHAIAGKIGVCAASVSNIRNELRPKNKDTRIGVNGKAYDVKHMTKRGASKKEMRAKIKALHKKVWELTSTIEAMRLADMKKRPAISKSTPVDDGLNLPQQAGMLTESEGS